MTLAKYKKKRDFKKTPEPKGKVKRSRSSKLKYIIQKHAASHLHYDFRLEHNGVLLSWAIPKGPCLDPSIKRLAMHVEDHPIEYGKFEGIIPKGQYGGGTVMLWDKGEWIPEDKDPAKAYHQGNLKFTIKGKKLNGLWKLIRMHKDDKTWLLIKVKDNYSKNIKQYDITKEEPNSIQTQQTLEEIANNYKHTWGKDGLKKSKSKKKTSRSDVKVLKHSPDINFNIKPSSIPNDLSPQLATLVDHPPLGKQWLHEIKFDGYRIIAIKSKGKTKLMSRNNKDWTSKFKTIANAIDNLPIKNIIFDGEIVVLDDNNKSDFQMLQNSLKDDSNRPFYYYIFDLIYYDKYNLTSLPLLERKNYLKKILNNLSDILIYSDHIFGSGKKILEKTCELSLEGIISKDSTSSYLFRRTKTWLKSKCIKRQEFVIGGYTKPKGSRNRFGALLIGTYNKRAELIYNGNVGTGFTQTSLETVYNLLEKNTSTHNPFTSKPPGVKNITWVKPILIADIEFTEWTKDSYLRHPSFKGLRSDKKPIAVKKEIPIHVENINNNSKQKNESRMTHKLTNPHKILYPEDKFTKQNITEYYENINEWILPFICQRPLTLVRCPNGYKECFYQKHLTDSMPDSLHGITIKEKHGKSEYIYLNDISGLLALPQLGVLEIHPWGSHIETVEYPDMIIFDLDPSPEVSWKKVVDAAKNIKQQLLELKLKSFIKTTGGKGLHVVVPIKPEYDWEEVKNFTHAFVDYLVLNNPKEYISKMSKSARKGKIFIDYLRNQRGATAIAPYSTRARIHAPVSTPLHWDELTNNFKDTFFTITSLPLRLKKLKKDPWENFFKLRQTLNLKKYK